MPLVIYCLRGVDTQTHRLKYTNILMSHTKVISGGTAKLPQKPATLT